jgi:plasmid stabilization system protein ParE
VGGYLARPAVDEDLSHSARWIALDNPDAARRFLDTAFKGFEFLAAFPEAGPTARLKPARLKDIRFWVLPPPFNRWLVFYRVEAGTVVVIRVLHSAQNWRRRTRTLL